MFPIPIRVGASLALSAVFGCASQGKDDATSQATSTGPGTSGTDETTPTTTASSGESGTSDPSGTTSTSTGETGTAETGPVLPEWCNGFNPDTVGFTVLDDMHEKIVDGSTLRVVCGGQGLLMIPVYPQFGFMPGQQNVGIDFTLTVEGYNVVNGDHFAGETAHAHKIDCSDEEDTFYGGYRYSFIPMFPPDSIPDVNVIDGKPGHLHMTLHAPDGDEEFDADVVMAAMIDGECNVF